MCIYIDITIYFLLQPKVWTAFTVIGSVINKSLNTLGHIGSWWAGCQPGTLSPAILPHLPLLLRSVHCLPGQSKIALHRPIRKGQHIWCKTCIEHNSHSSLREGERTCGIYSTTSVTNCLPFVSKNRSSK